MKFETKVRRVALALAPSAVGGVQERPAWIWADG